MPLTDTITIGRCRDCRWWEDKTHVASGQGICLGLNHGDTIYIDAPGDEAYLYTRQDFGCVAFERRGAAG